MASYLRFLFGGSHSNTATTATTPSTTPSKSHHSHRPSSKDRKHSSHSHRSHSAPTQHGLTYAYAPPPPSSSHGSRGRKYSENTIPHATAKPSPLRYDTTSSRERSSSKKPYARPTERPALQKMPAYSPGEPHPPTAVHHPVFYHSSSSFASSRTGSSTSISANSSRYPTPPIMTNTSSTSVSSTAMPRRPALKQSHTWDASGRPGKTARVAFQNPDRSETLNMHPLFACTRFNQAPISYDVLTPPTAASRTVLDRTTRSPVPQVTLSQPATDPPSYNRLILTSDRFAWRVIVDTSPKFFLAGNRKPSHVPITNLDVIEAIYRTLHTRVTQEEWAQLGNGSRTQRKATSAYNIRCQKMGGNPKDGVKRVDFLGEKTRLIGIEVDKNSDAPGGRVAKMVFGKPQ